MSEFELKRPVVFAGENPLILLYRPGGDDAVAVASYWRCVYAPEGEGEALVIWVDPKVSGQGERAPVGIYTDNAAMARMVWEKFNRHFAPLQNRGIEDGTPQTARFVQAAEGRRLHRVMCSAGPSTIELRWEDAFDAFQTVANPEVAGQGWEVSNVVLPCAKASISVDGERVPGEVHHPEGDYQSSAFLAFCESWVSLSEGLKTED